MVESNIKIIYYLVFIGTNLVVLVAFFVTLRNDIKKRPTYIKVEEMIDDRAVTKEKGSVMANDVKHLTDDMNEIKDLLNNTNKMISNMQQSLFNFLSNAKCKPE